MSDHTHRCGGSGAPACGAIWFIGWLFTIGYVHLSFWPAVLGIIIWPYYLGKLLSPITG